MTSVRKQRGLSLIELVIFIVVISVGIVGILSALNVSTRYSADPLVRKQALAIAEAMMEEVLSKDFANPADGFSPATPGNPTQNERPSFDDVDDYNMTGGWNWNGATRLATGIPAVPGLGNYTITITVANALLNGIPVADAKAITVMVSGRGETITLVGYRTNYE